jgi:hypothetical protein
MKLTTQLHLVPRPRTRGAILPLPQYASIVAQLKHRDTFTSFSLAINLEVPEKVGNFWTN